MRQRNPEHEPALLTHRDLFRDAHTPVARCWRDGKLSLTTRLAHRAVRLMRARGAEEIYHYRCSDCHQRHLTSMSPDLWPQQPPLNSPAVFRNPDDFDTDAA